ncbi:MAG: fumarylacetoacetate hydrolase family protein [Microthrixaceae bacterium]
MKIARIRIGDTAHLARIDGELAHPLDSADRRFDTLVDPRTALGTQAPRSAFNEPVLVESVEMLAPVERPGSVIAIGLNYADHALESGLEPPSAPVTFAKLPQSVIGPGEVIRWDQEQSTEVDYEAELAVVIGTEARDVPVGSALQHVLGYTCCNDVSARDAQFADGQWLRAKSFDTFCPLGPWIVTPDEIADVQNLRIACRVNGEYLQDSTTSQMIFGVDEIISYLSRFITLLPGDVITTGTPVGVGFARTPPIYLSHGDTVEIVIEGIGVLRNTCGPVMSPAGDHAAAQSESD